MIKGDKNQIAQDGETAADNIDLVRRVFAAFGRRDVNTILAALSPEVEWGEPDNPYNPAGGTRHGHEGFLEWLRIGQQSEDIMVLEPRQFLAGGDSVAVVGYLRCRAKSTGKVYESDFVHLVTIKHGKITHFQEFFDTYSAGEAFRAHK